MQIIDVVTLRKTFKNTMEKVCDDNDIAIITRENLSPIVMISLENYQAIEKKCVFQRSHSDIRSIFRR